MEVKVETTTEAIGHIPKEYYIFITFHLPQAIIYNDVL